MKDAVIREVWEETGLKVEPLQVVDAADVIVPGRGGPKYHFVLVAFLVHILGGTLKAASDAAETRWVRLSELEGLDVTPTTRLTIERWESTLITGAHM